MMVRISRKLILGMLAVCMLAASPVLAGNMWFKVAGGISAMGMDDINDGDFQFYDDSETGYDLPPIDSGFNLGFHIGSNINRHWAMGFSWEVQHAHTSGTDVDIDATLKLDANFAMIHFYWTPLRGEKFSAGAAAGFGIAIADGTVNIDRGSTNFGEGDTTGTDLALDLLGVFEYALSPTKGLQLTAGWREATIKPVQFASSTATNEDGSELELDYSGFSLKLGVVWRFGDQDGGPSGNIQ